MCDALGHLGVGALRRGRAVVLVCRLASGTCMSEPMTKGAYGSGSGRASAQDLMVAGGRYLFCELICLFLSLVHNSLSILWLLPKPM